MFWSDTYQIRVLGGDLLGRCLVLVVVHIGSSELLEKLVVLGACSSDDLVTSEATELDGPLADGSASRPDKKLGGVLSHLGSTLGEVRDGNGKAVEERLAGAIARFEGSDVKKNVRDAILAQH